MTLDTIHTHRVEASPPATTTADLSQFAITQNAFLPAESMPEVLSDAYYQPWEQIAVRLPEHIRNSTIRDAIANLPTLSTSRLKSEAEWRRAHVILGYLTSAYTWGGDEPKDVVPPQLAVPFLESATHLEIPPWVSYAVTNLWNFKSTKKQDFSNINDLDVLVSFTGTEDERWFLMLSIVMEAQAASAIETVMSAIEATDTSDYVIIIEALKALRMCIDNVSAIMVRMYESCNPAVFYHHIRPFLAGSKNMEHAGLPRGVFFDKGNGEGEWKQLRGGSNGQSSMIQFFDIVLGVDHNSHGSSGQKSFHDEVREYMPGPHKRFLEYISNARSLREAVLHAPPTETELRSAYLRAVEALTAFRDKHIQIVTRYIILPSKKAMTSETSRKNLATASSEKSGDNELTGTGGTTLVPFLKHVRDETTQVASVAL